MRKQGQYRGRRQEMQPFGYCNCRVALLVAIILLTCPLPGISEDKNDYVSYVSSRVGTASRYDLGFGSTLPFVGRPWGMNNWAPQTNDKSFSSLGLHKWWFHPDDAFFYGFRCTHQASPWIYDYGQFMLTPAMGLEQTGWPNKASAYNRSSATFGPDHVNLYVDADKRRQSLGHSRVFSFPPLL